MYEKIKRWYNQGLWNSTQVHQAVEKGVLTEKQYTEIVGGTE